jgi:hypothetical protein
MSSRDPAVTNFNISPALLGKPTAPTAAAGTNTTQIATTAFANTAGGLVLIANSTFTSVASVTISNVFSALYDNYHISFNIFSSSTGATYSSFQLCVSGTPTTSGYYSKSMWYDIANAATFAYVNSDGRGDGMSLGPIGFSSAGEGSYDVDVHYPFVSRNTRMSGHGSGLYAGAYYCGVTTAGLQTGTTSFDGIKLLPTASTITGTMAIYGYKKS